MSDRRQSPANAAERARGNLLSSAIRRDVADLNRLFLCYALDAAVGSDPWFSLPAPAVVRLVAAPVEVREQVALSPFALFDLRLPGAVDASDCMAGAVADAHTLAPPDRTQAEARRAFGLVALGVARRLAENMPMSPRIAFGVGAEAESRLSGLSPSESFSLASWPGLIRPRWPRHDRFWCMLANAAAAANTEMLEWAFAAGLCLLGQADRDLPGTHAAGRRKPRPDPVRR